MEELDSANKDILIYFFSEKIGLAGLAGLFYSYRNSGTFAIRCKKAASPAWHTE